VAVQKQISESLTQEEAKRVRDELNALMCKFLGHGAPILMNEIIYSEC
jgi:hypothetical protein